MAASLACFVSPHGFGHAARACAVMASLAELMPAIRFEIFTLVPEWFFAESLGGGFARHACRSDIGMVQRTSLAEDAEATLAALADFVPFPEPLLDALAGRVVALGCRAVLADISPLGLAVAARAGLPSVLLENFTWDWIYESMLPAHPGFARPISLLADVFARATVHVQTTPACRPVAAARTVPPLARAPRVGREATRERLGVSRDQPLLLLTMGGVPWRFAALDRLAAHRSALLVVPGAAERVERRGSLLTLPHHSSFYHPDLIAAADLVIAKLGYSTLAEALCVGVPMLYVERPSFRESPVLARYVAAALPSRAIDQAALDSGDWLAAVDDMLVAPRPPARPSGAAEVARVLLELLER